jgi:hypothetical protein
MRVRKCEETPRWRRPGKPSLRKTEFANSETVLLLVSIQILHALQSDIIKVDGTVMTLPVLKHRVIRACRNAGIQLHTYSALSMNGGELSFKLRLHWTSPKALGGAFMDLPVFQNLSKSYPLLCIMHVWHTWTYQRMGFAFWGFVHYKKKTSFPIRTLPSSEIEVHSFLLPSFHFLIHSLGHSHSPCYTLTHSQNLTH